MSKTRNTIQELQILTDNGFKNLSDVKIGEVVYDSEGRKTTIKSKRNIKVDNSYILFINGKIGIKMLDNQQLNFYRKEISSQCRKRDKNGKTTEKRDIKYFINSYSTSINKFNRDLKVSEHYPFRIYNCSNKFKGSKKDLPLNPYYLGLLLGDGSFFGSPTFTVNIKDYPEIEKSLKKLAKSIGDEANVYKRKRNNLQLRIKGQNTLRQLRLLNLDKHNSFTKFIPNEYLMSTRENRLQILKGLMDTDGTFVIADTSLGKGIKYKHISEFDSTSKQLTQDVGFIVLSLGGSIDSLYKKRCSYRKNNKTHFLDSNCYRYNIRMPKDISIFNAKNKKQKEKSCKLKSYKMYNLDKKIEAIKQSKKFEKFTRITLSNGSTSYIGNCFMKIHI